jgi:transcriptional regulator with XRE-family HTH domain
MQARGMGLRELCRAAGLDPSFLSKVLAGKRSPPSEEEALRRIASALGMDEPALVVAAGRIPREWSGLWSDEALFNSVHGLASGTRLAGRYREQARLPRPGERTESRRPSPDLAEELL